MKKRITYQKIFWLFVFGSLLGVLLEGCWVFAKHGHWETHVVSVWGPFCVLYGIGLAGCYIGAILLEKRSLLFKFVVFSMIGSAVELLSGVLLAEGLHMYAWNYSSFFMNYKGYVSLSMSLMWGVLGVAFTYLVPFVEKIFQHMQGKPWKALCAGLTVFLIIDFTVTAMSFVRWSERHEGIEATNSIERLVDQRFDDDWMKERFCEWRFIK